MKISVIIPVFNGEQYIERCINSLKIQTFSDFEIIIIDDGSTDSTGEICDAFEKTEPNVKVIHTKNNGQAIARNHGIDAASGAYISFVDADDWLSKDALATMLECAEQGKYDIVSFCFFRVANRTTVHRIRLSEGIIDKNGTTEEKKRYDRFKVSAFFGYVCGKLYKTAFIKENDIRFENSKKVLMEDALFNLIAISYNPSYFVSNEPVYYYYIRPQSASNISTDIEKNAISLIEQYSGFLNRQKIYNKSMDLFLPLLGRVFSWTIFKKMGESEISFKALISVIRHFMTQPAVKKALEVKAKSRLMRDIPLAQKAMYMFCFAAGKYKRYRLIGFAFMMFNPLFKIYINLFVRH